MRYKLVAWLRRGGEGGAVFYIIDKAAEDQPEVVCSYRNREEAEEALRCLNMAGVVIH